MKRRLLWPGVLILLVGAILVANVVLVVQAVRHPPRPVDTTEVAE